MLLIMLPEKQILLQNEKDMGKRKIGVQSAMDFGEWDGAAKFCDDLHFTRYSAHIYTKTKLHHLRYDSRSAKN